MSVCFECGGLGGMWGLCESCQADRTARVRASLSEPEAGQSESKQAGLGDFR